MLREAMSLAGVPTRPRARWTIRARRRLATARRLVKRWGPFLIGAVMFGFAVWVLHRTASRFHIEQLGDELEKFSTSQLLLAVFFTACSFCALIGYEYSALGLIGRRLPLRQLALASYVTQSISHSTGFAFFIGATLRYQFYSPLGFTVADVAKVQLYFTLTFALGVTTLAGAVVMFVPDHLASFTGTPPWLWRIAAVVALILVAAYIAWGAFFHRSFHLKGYELTFPRATATLEQIFFGVADLIAVAAALYVLLPAGLHLSYLETLAIFMASIVVGLLSHVPGSLGVFRSAVLLLVQPADDQVLPLIGSLLAFRATYYLLPLVCGVALLTVTEFGRWRDMARHALTVSREARSGGSGVSTLGPRPPIKNSRP